MNRIRITTEFSTTDEFFNEQVILLMEEIASGKFQEKLQEEFPEISEIKMTHELII